MLNVILNILGILGILLLVILGFIILTILLVLFVPITYKAEADRQALSGDMHVSVKAGWLLGFIRMRFLYPEPGNIVLKILCFTLFDSNNDSDKHSDKDSNNDSRKRQHKRSKTKNAADKSVQTNKDYKADVQKDTAGEHNKEYKENISKEYRKDINKDISEDIKDINENVEENKNDSIESDKNIFNIFKKIKKSLQKIYYTLKTICDKIKNIRDNTNHYKEILLCDDTKGLLNHAFMRIGKILKSIRPRKLRADIRLGTGSPDTTGYVYGIYGMLCAYLGKHVLLTPDFEKSVLEGEIYMSGYITIFKLLWHALRLVTDKRLRELMDKF